jgi:hypothetical protein
MGTTAVPSPESQSGLRSITKYVASTQDCTVTLSQVRIVVIYQEFEFSEVGDQVD